MQPHQQRVIDERQQLRERLDKLENFLAGDLFKSLSHEEGVLLWAQRGAMAQYLAVLDRRVAIWKLTLSTPIPAMEDLDYQDLFRDAEQLHAELLDLLADGFAQHLLDEAREEAEAALGRPLRSAAALTDEASLSPLVERPRARRAARGA